jgi:hypothetical protein
MSQLIIAGDTSGTVTLQAPAVAGSTTLTLPATTGTVLTTNAGVAPSTAGNVLTSDGTNWTSASKITSASAQASTSGTSIDFTNIPSWAKRITVMLSGVSTSASGLYIIQLGTGSTPTYTTTGYISLSSWVISANQCTVTSATNGLLLVGNSGATSITQAVGVIYNITGNTWTESGTATNGAVSYSTSGNIALAAALTAIRVTTTTSDTFDAGTVNIMYE